MFLGNLRIDLKLSNIEDGCQAAILCSIKFKILHTEFQRNVNETKFKDQKTFTVKITKYCVNISCVL